MVAIGAPGGTSGEWKVSPTLGMTPFEAFYGTRQVHGELVMRRDKQMKMHNKNKRMVVEPMSLPTENRVLVYEFELMDRGRLGKLAVQWASPHGLGEKKSAMSWEVKFRGGKVQQVHHDHLQKYD